jgi:hypothetical protein
MRLFWHGLAILAILTFVYIAAIPQTVGLYPETTTIGTGVKSFDELGDRFIAVAEEKGAPYALALLARAPLPQGTDIHLLGHYVGEVLYKQEGVSGMRFCTPDFRNACSHAIVVRAFQEYGEDALSSIHEACLRAPGGNGAYTMCYHGLGHGIFSVTKFSLPETVALCKKTGTQERHFGEYGECVGGAIMELMGGGGHDPEGLADAQKRYLNDADPLSVCTASYMPQEIRERCVVYLTPHIWRSVGMDLGRPDPTQFAEAFGVCRAVPLSDPVVRSSCFAGFGKEFPGIVTGRDSRHLENLTDDSFRDMSRWCTYAQDEDGEKECMRSALRFLVWGGEHDPAVARRFCALAVSELQRQSCHEYLIEEYRYYFKSEDYTALCKQLPERYHEACMKGM